MIAVEDSKQDVNELIMNAQVKNWVIYFLSIC